MKKLFAIILRQRMFLWFLLVAGLLWLITHLSQDHTSDVLLRVTLVNDFEGRQWVEEPDYDLDVEMKSDGRRLFLYKLGFMPDIELQVSKLRFTRPNAEGVCRIDPLVMKAALQDVVGASARIVSVGDTLRTVRVSPIKSRRVAIRGRVEVYPVPQYMIVGGVRYEQDSVVVRAPAYILDTLKSIPTASRIFKKVRSEMRGAVDLIIPEGCLVKQKQVAYTAEVAGFTEMDFKVPVVAVNTPPATRTLIVPASVEIKIRVPLDKYRRDLTPRATVDYIDRIPAPRLTTLRPVIIDSLPRGAELLTVEPAFVEPFFKRQ